MDWKTIAAKLAQMGLPVLGRTIGTLVGGQVPIFGDMIEGAGENIGKAAADMIARSLGVEPTPDAIGQAIERMPTTDVMTRLQGVEAEAMAKWPALAEMHKADAADRTAQSQAINETMRSEIAAGVSPWHWRHLLGYVTLFWFVMPLPAFVRLTISFNADASMALVQIITAATPILAIMAALLGYVAQDSNKLKTAAITGEQPKSFLGTASETVKAVVKKK
jgi:hypothetical protein